MRATPRAAVLLGNISLGYVLASLALMGPGLPLSYDEDVYASQVSGLAPPAVFSGSRARGITYLIAPITSWTNDPAILRIYLAVLAGLALFLVYALWLKVSNSLLVPLAALLFVGTWVALFEAPSAMPNLWVAFGAVAATALTVLSVRGNKRGWSLAGLAVVLATVALFRPSDALLLGFPIGVALLWGLRKQRTKAILLAIAAVGGGVAIGWVPWLIESFTLWGGLKGRMDAASSATYAHFGIHIFEQWRAVNGPANCYPCHEQSDISIFEAGFWLVLVALAIVGLVAAWRKQGSVLGMALLMLASAAALCVTYFVLIPVAAARFMLPTYALLSFVCAGGLIAIVRWAAERWRPVMVAALALGLLGHFAIQYSAYGDVHRRSASARKAYAAAAQQIIDLGIRPPCLVIGPPAIDIGYLTGCHSMRRHPISELIPPTGTGTTELRIVAATTGPMSQLSWLPWWQVQPSGPRNDGWQIYLYTP